MNGWAKFSIGFLVLSVLAILASGCASKGDRGVSFRRVASLTGNPFAEIAIDAIYGSGDVQDYRLPPGWDLAFAPVDENGNWVEGVAGYVPYLFPVTGDVAASFIPAAYIPANRTTTPPKGTFPSYPLRPLDAQGEPVRPGLQDVIDELTETLEEAER